jgi:hypothetical protein
MSAGLVLLIGATMRFQRVTVVSGGNAAESRWRVLLPGQPSEVPQPPSTKLTTDEYVGFGLLRIGGRASWKETSVHVY